MREGHADKGAPAATTAQQGATECIRRASGLTLRRARAAVQPATRCPPARPAGSSSRPERRVAGTRVARPARHHHHPCLPQLLLDVAGILHTQQPQPLHRPAAGQPARVYGLIGNPGSHRCFHGAPVRKPESGGQDSSSPPRKESFSEEGVLLLIACALGPSGIMARPTMNMPARGSRHSASPSRCRRAAACSAAAEAA